MLEKEKFDTCSPEILQTLPVTYKQHTNTNLEESKELFFFTPSETKCVP